MMAGEVVGGGNVGGEVLVELEYEVPVSIRTGRGQGGSVQHAGINIQRDHNYSADRHLSRFAPFKKIITGNCSWNSNLASDTESLASL